MLASKRMKVVLIGFAALLIVGAGVLAVIKIRNQNKPAVATVKAIDLAAKSRDEALSKQISNSEVVTITKLLYDKKYEEVVTKAKDLCKTTTGKDQAACYNTYASALMGKNDLKALDTVSTEALGSDYIKNDAPLTEVWQNIQKKAQAGVNPSATASTESE